MTKVHVYEVIVGNIGCVYHGFSWRDAMRDFMEYREQSLAGYGRASNEPVTLIRDNEVEQEYVPENMLKD